MITDFQLQRIQERVASIRTRPMIGMFIDLDSVLSDLNECVDDDSFETIQDREIADALYSLTSSVGRPGTMKVYYSSDLERQDGIDHADWKRRNIVEVRTPHEGLTRDGINLHMLFDAYEAATQGKIDIAVLIVGQTDYTSLARRILDLGVTVMLVGNYNKERRVLPRDNCLYVPMRSILVEDGRVVGSVDVESFDFSQFVRLLSVSESMMPFVGVRYFIQKVMWRLGPQFRNSDNCQRLFQAAKERGLVEVYKTDNVDDAAKQVSACRLNRENQEVLDALEDMEEATSRQHDEDGYVPQQQESSGFGATQDTI